MAVIDQEVTDRYAIYCGDCVETMRELPDKSVDLSIYSPPFATSTGALYTYSSSDRDLSNSRNYDEFFEHYGYVVRDLARLTKPGRMSAVHCVDVPSGNTGRDHLMDFPGDIIRLHNKCGFKYVGRYHIWKDPFVVYLRTLAKSLRHRTCTEDSTKCAAAGADYLLVFRRDGENKVPVTHPTGLMHYAGSREPPADILKYRGWSGKQTENKYSQWVWRQYASAFWDDVRLERVLPYREAKDEADERHVHPLQLDVVDRCVTLWSNPKEVVFTPFMGVGSEVFGAVTLGRKGVGVELKPTYFKQAQLNMQHAEEGKPYEDSKQRSLFDDDATMGDDTEEDEAAQ
jgi:DNA modification methylase